MNLRRYVILLVLAAVVIGSLRIGALLINEHDDTEFVLAILVFASIPLSIVELLKLALKKLAKKDKPNEKVAR